MKEDNSIFKTEFQRTYNLNVFNSNQLLIDKYLKFIDHCTIWHTLHTCLLYNRFKKKYSDVPLTADMLFNSLYIRIILFLFIINMIKPLGFLGPFWAICFVYCSIRNYFNNLM